MVCLVRLDVIINAFEAFEPLQELVHFVGVVQVGEILPFDVETLFHDML